MQLPLPVTLPADETFSSFIATCNEQLVTMLSSLAASVPHWQAQTALSAFANQRLPLCIVTGPSGRGKSHLLYACCHHIAHRQVDHIYLNLSDTAQWSPGVFDGLENLAFIALDNVHAIAGDPQWEEALFDLLNRVMEQRACVILCSSAIGPANPAFLLPDLRSRLQWGMAYQLQSLDDDSRKLALQYRAEQKGLNFSATALQFLLTHYDRNLTSLMQMLDRLDTRSLQEQRKITVALVKRELGL
ncbi:DnaA regulatory inactivator Hda [Salinimonas lutimaris]|uniref:DnaA regulatory inactivator Hda n=1 Tax=Salinimonas lutimaris TaxID=914153 RepID=UPI0010C0B5CF|nr:DnaA regulatory inactivator Hda [Salinimonas lutimaris]